MYILGINHGRNTAAALVKAGDLLYACEEERFNRQKGTSKFPLNSIRFCLEEEGIHIKDIDSITFSYDMSIGVWDSILLGLRYFPRSLEAFFVRLTQLLRSGNYITLLGRAFGVSKKEIKKKCRFIEHHLTHSANVYFCSGFESAAILSIDGSGEIDTMLMARANGNKITKLGSVKFPHSVGMLYSTFTQFLGFRIDNGEGKVMGLAPYGKPIFLGEFSKIIWPLPGGKFKMNMSYFRYQFTANKKKPFYSKKLVKSFGLPRIPESKITKRDEDVAATLQEVTERMGVHIAKHLYEVTREKNLCISGGVALNSVMNYKIMKESGFENVYVYPASQDAGTAIGSALYYYYCVLGNPRKKVNSSAYLGPQYSNDQIEALLKEKKLSYRKVNDPSKVAAELIFNGKIIGWFQGREEIGPRALGSRSIICDPRPPDMKDILNQRVKHREPFRPFAPSVKIENYKEYFETDVPSPYMLFVCAAKKEKKEKIQATLHVDDTARLQTVAKEDHPAFWALIDEFEKLSGVPVVLNTSFNVRGEPIVLSPKDAVHCYLGTNLDALVIGDFVTEK